MFKNNFTEGKHSIGRCQGNGWMDFSELRAMDSLHNEGTNALVMGCLGWGAVCQVWAHGWAPLGSHWLVLMNGGAYFYDCWLVDSI